MNIIETCPLGSKCEKHTAEGLERCAWYMELAGKHPQTGESIPSRWYCAMVAQVIIGLDGNKLTNEMAASVQSHRNEVGKLNDAFHRIPLRQLPA